MSTHIQIGDVSPRIQYTGDGVQVEFTYPFPIFADGDLQVYLDDAEQLTGYSVAGAGGSSGGTVTFATAPASGISVTLRRNIPVARTSDFQESGEFRARVINDELDKLVAMVQQVEIELSRVLRLAATDADEADLTLPVTAARADRVLAFGANGDPLVSTKTLGALESEADNAAASASAAAVSATDASASSADAAASESNAAASAGAAASSAAAAQAAASSMLWTDVVYKTQADSPIAITDADKGKLFSVDCSAGGVTANLPSIAGETLPFNIGFKKTDASGNAITLVPGGADTVNGAASKVIGVAGSGVTLIADTDPDPDDWTAAEFGAVAGNMTVDTFADGIDFTSGTTTQLMLSVDPGNETNVTVTFDGVTQHHDTFSVAGTALTFAGPIPLGISSVEVVSGTTVSLGTPADGTVGTLKLADGAVTQPKLADNAVSTSKIVPNGITIPKLAMAMFQKGALPDTATVQADFNGHFSFDLTSTQNFSLQLPSLTPGQTAGTMYIDVVASGADRTVTLGTGLIEQAGAGLTVPSGKTYRFWIVLKSASVGHVYTEELK